MKGFNLCLLDCLPIFGAVFSYFWPLPPAYRPQRSLSPICSANMPCIKVKESGPQRPHGGRISFQMFQSFWASLSLSISNNPRFWPTWPTWPIPVADQKKVRHPKILPCTARSVMILGTYDWNWRLGVKKNGTLCDIMWRLTPAEIEGSMGKSIKIWCWILGILISFASS